MQLLFRTLATPWKGYPPYARPITMHGSSAFEKNYQEKQVFHSKLSAGATCPNEQQLGRLEICSGFLDVIVSQYFTFRTQRNDSKTHNYASVV